MRISVVMSYFNRKNLLEATLKSIAETKVPEKDYEIIIVDDASDPEHVLTEDMFNKDFYNIKLISITKEQKTWVNSCTGFNFGIRAATGDILIIQNPECVHVGDVLSHALESVTNNNYLSYHCFSANAVATTRILHRSEKNNLNYESLTDAIQPLENNGSWYNHRTYRPVAYHFLNAVKSHHVFEMRGFDERFAPGIAFEDDEFKSRIKFKGLEIMFVENPFCIHLEHFKFSYNYAKSSEWIERNRALFKQVLKDRKWKVNEDRPEWQ